MCSDSPKIVGQKPSVKFFRVAPYVEVNSLTFEEAGCLKKHPATSKGGRPHSDIGSDFKAYQTKQFSRDIWCNSITTIVPPVSTAFLLLASVIAGEDRKAF